MTDDKPLIDVLAEAAGITSRCSPIESDLAKLPDDAEITLTFTAEDIREIRAALARYEAEKAGPRFSLLQEYLWCPKCQQPHVDRGEWATPAKAHHKHLCEHCGNVWDAGHIGIGVEPPKTDPQPAPVCPTCGGKGYVGKGHNAVGCSNPTCKPTGGGQ